MSPHTYCAFPTLTTQFSLMYIFSVSVLILDPIIIKWAMWVWQTRPQQSRWALKAPYPFRNHLWLLFLFFFFLTPCVWCETAGHPNSWTSLKAAQVSSQSCLSSQRLHAEPEVLRSHPLLHQRPAESVVGATAIVCRAGVLPPTCSEDLQRASELRAEMLSVPGTVNMLGMQTMKGMWNLVPRWGLFVINAAVWGQIQLVAGEVNTPYVQSWAQFSIQHNASLVFHPTL